MNVKKVIWNLKNPDLIDRQTLSQTLHEAAELLSVSFCSNLNEEKEVAEQLEIIENKNIMGG